MLEIRDVSLRISIGEGTELLSGVDATFPSAHFGAIIGPSGCGKTSLLKLIAGIAPGEEDGEIRWQGRNLAQEDFRAGEISYVPQFSLAPEELSVRECIEYALALRVRQECREKAQQTVDHVLEEVGLKDIARQAVKTLSGGQLRRLALAAELTSQPAILLCDEVTSGLDPKAVGDLVQLLRKQARDAGRLVLSATHSLDHLDLYDSVLVMYRGVVAYHGSPADLASYFAVENSTEIFEGLDRCSPEEWSARWRSLGHTLAPDAQGGGAPPSGEARLPGPWRQVGTLLHRRALLFFRSQGELSLQLGFILAFPLLVAFFAWHGLPAIEHLSTGLGAGGLEQFKEGREFLIRSSKLGNLLSGLAMFQVVLLTLMAANNAGREIAVERPLFEKEKLSGLSPFAYLAAKVVFLFCLVTVQSLWMGIFVNRICGFPGSLSTQLISLLLVNGAVTALCLALSSLLHSAEQASLASIYLVGFQIPLSGAVLALPEPAGPFLRPLVSAYWGWSGVLDSLKLERCYDMVQSIVPSPLAPTPICVWILCTHIGVGLLVTWIGCERRQPF